MSQEPAFKPAELAALVLNARGGLRLSRAAVAGAIGLTTEWLRQLEQVGQSDMSPKQPRPENIRALAHVLRLDEALALDLAGHSSDAPIDLTRTGRPTCSEVAFTANVNRLPAPLRRMFFDFAEAVASSVDRSVEGEPTDGRAA